MATLTGVPIVAMMISSQEVLVSPDVRLKQPDEPPGKIRYHEPEKDDTRCKI
jgi:hypothetical protein